MLINCDYCNKRFLRSLGEINKNKKRGSKNYCSIKCVIKARSGKNNPMYNKEHTKATREKMHFVHIGLKHTQKSKVKMRGLRLTMNKEHLYERAGENHPNWRGGITPKNEKERKSLKNKLPVRL